MLSSNLLSKESIGFTESGQKIILNSDFTWEYFKDDQVSVDEIFYTDENVKITLVESYFWKGPQNRLRYKIILSVKSLLKNSYLKINTHHQGRSHHPNFLIIKDNFENSLGLYHIYPTVNKSIRPYEQSEFIIHTKETPLNSISYLKLTGPKGIFGNIKEFTLKIPSTRIIRR